MVFHCPYCKLELQQLDRSTTVTCPECFEPFFMPARNDWLLGIVGALLVNCYRVFLVG